MKWESIPCIVSFLNSSLLYSDFINNCPLFSETKKVKSNFATGTSLSTSEIIKSPATIPDALGVLLNTSITWKTGERDGSLSFKTASTTFSNGTSLCWYASRLVCFTCCNKSINDSLLSTWLLKVSVFTKKPTNAFISSWLRLASDAPTAISL